MSEPRVFVVTLPRGLVLFTANDRHHRFKEAKLIAAIREAAGWAAKAARVPRLERARIDVVYHPPTNRIRDASNLHPAVKPAVDGIALDAGVLADDNDRYVDGPHVTIGDRDLEAAKRKLRWGTLVLTLTELPALEQEADHG